ncbi:50S ribosomal protein L33 [Salirhabdus sp. Marseille-P4669]|nr:50S ribosomal protein L33 [Salirhabdus sp. Marseille-P4669]
MRTKIVLACVDCQSRNYTTYKESSSARLEIKKYCKTCSKHTMHRETK